MLINNLMRKALLKNSKKEKEWVGKRREIVDMEEWATVIHNSSINSYTLILNSNNSILLVTNTFIKE